MDAAVRGTANRTPQRKNFNAAGPVKRCFISAPPVRRIGTSYIKEISTARAVGQIGETMIRLPLKSGARENRKTRVFGINGLKEKSLTLVKSAAAIRPD